MRSASAPCALASIEANEPAAGGLAVREALIELADACGGGVGALVSVSPGLQLDAEPIALVLDAEVEPLRADRQLSIDAPSAVC